MTEVYVSTDVETDGPIPGTFSMLSFGSAAFAADGRRLDTFTANLEPLPGARTDPDTMDWWRARPEAWEAARRDAIPPARAMDAYLRWIEALPGRPVFVAYPLGFDFLFVQWYLVRFTGRRPFGHSGVDVKSFAMALLGHDYRRSTKRFMPRHWFGDHPHTHVALDDAIGQGQLFVTMLAESRERARRPGDGAGRRRPPRREGDGDGRDRSAP